MNLRQSMSLILKDLGGQPADDSTGLTAITREVRRLIAELKDERSAVLTQLQEEQQLFRDLVAKGDRAITRVSNDKKRLGKILDDTRKTIAERKEAYQHLHQEHRELDQLGMQLLAENANLKRQLRTQEARTRAAEEDLALRKRVDKRVREALDKERDEATKLRKELGWIPSAFDSYKRGIGRIAPELSHMAQLAIMELERQADDWLKPTDDS